MATDPVIPDNLERIGIPADAGDLAVPGYVDAFIRDAENRAEAYGDRAGGGTFVPSDSRYAFQVLQWLLREDLLQRGGLFLEWGCGQGVASLLAASLGLRATGVDIDPVLVQEASGLATRFGIRARFVHGSYDPGTPGLPVLTAEGSDATYVYPWPGEEGYFLRLFNTTACTGALLLMGLGPEDIRVYRKTGATGND